MAVGLCEVMIIWIIATYIQCGNYLLRVGRGGPGAGCVVRFGFAVYSDNYSDVIEAVLVSLLLTLGLFRILLWRSRC